MHVSICERTNVLDFLSIAIRLNLLVRIGCTCNGRQRCFFSIFIRFLLRRVVSNKRFAIPELSSDVWMFQRRKIFWSVAYERSFKACYIIETSLAKRFLNTKCPATCKRISEFHGCTRTWRDDEWMGFYTRATFTSTNNVSQGVITFRYLFFNSLVRYVLLVFKSQPVSVSFAIRRRFIEIRRKLVSRFLNVDLHSNASVVGSKANTRGQIALGDTIPTSILH